MADCLELKKLHVIPTGGDSYEQAREQWDDGNNVIAIEPGVIIGYASETRYATLLTQIEVDPDDPAFARPTKPEGAVCTRPGAERLRSARSRATSTAAATDMPTSAACRAGAALMPSPRSPTECPVRCKVRTIRSFFAAGRFRRIDRCAARGATAPRPSSQPLPPRSASGLRPAVAR